MLRNRRREKKLREQGVTEEDRIAKAKLLGEQDYTDFENPYVSLLVSLSFKHAGALHLARVFRS